MKRISMKETKIEGFNGCLCSDSNYCLDSCNDRKFCKRYKDAKKKANEKSV